MKKRLRVSILACVGTLIAACSAPGEVEARDVSPYILELRDDYLADVPPEGIQHEILADGYITDAELNEAYDKLVECLAGHGIVPGWDLNFGPGANYAPSVANQVELSAGLDEETWIKKWEEEITPAYDGCDLVNTYGIIQVYEEQVRSADGRPYFTRMRDAMVTCGFDEFTDYTDDQMEESISSFHDPENAAYADCFVNFLEADKL